MIMIGGFLLIGFIVVQQMGGLQNLIPSISGSNINIVNTEDDNYEDYDDYLECNDDNSRCKFCGDVLKKSNCNEYEEVCGSAVKTGGDSESRVLTRARRKWEEKQRDREESCHKRSSGPRKTTPTTVNKPPRSTTVSGLVPAGIKPGFQCKITINDCHRANPNSICKLNKTNKSCSCSCTPKKKCPIGAFCSNSVTLYKHSHDPLNIPRAYLTNVTARPTISNLHLNYV